MTTQTAAHKAQDTLRLYTVFQPFCDIIAMHFEYWYFFMNKKVFSFIGLCGKKQKEITKAIKRAQILGFMPVTYKDPAYLKDPKVCNIKYKE